jgi:hypothetical protein
MMMPVTQDEVNVTTQDTEGNSFIGFSFESVQGYVSSFTERLQSFLPSTTASPDIEMTATTDAATVTADEASNGFASFNLQAVGAYLSAATQYLTPSTERLQAVTDYVSAVPARVQAIPESVSQSCQSVSEFCKQNKDALIKGVGALFLVGVIITCSTGPSTCSTFNVINKTGKVLEINYLKPYSAAFSDAHSKHHDNHPTWYPRDYTFFETGRVSVDKGYTPEVIMDVDEAYKFFDESFEIHLNADGNPEHFFVRGRDDMHLTAPKMGFFVCTTELKNGAPPAPSNSTSTQDTDTISTSTEDTMTTRYLRG